MKNELTLLYPLRKPFSSAQLTRERDSDFTQVSLDIDGEFAGSLRVSMYRLANFLLHVLADVHHSVGYIENGFVEWVFEPDVFDFDVVIDEEGRFHNVKDLRRGT